MTSNLNMNSNKINNLTDKKKQVDGLFPQLWSTNTPVNGWKASASSEYSSSYLAYNVTLTNGEWATNGVSANFYVTITMPYSLQGVEPYGFRVKGRTSTNEQITN